MKITHLWLFVLSFAILIFAVPNQTYAGVLKWLGIDITIELEWSGKKAPFCSGDGNSCKAKIKLSTLFCPKDPLPTDPNQLPINVPEGAYVTIMRFDDPNLPQPHDGDIFELVEREFYPGGIGVIQLPFSIRIPTQNAIYREEWGGFLVYFYEL